MSLVPPSAAPVEDAPVWGPVVCVIVIAVANVIAYAANENSWVFKHCLRPLHVPPLLFISNRASCVDRRARPISYWAFDLLDPAHLVQSNCLNTGMLLVLHFCTFLYWVLTVIVDVALDYYHVWCHSPSCGRRYGAYGDWASYLTNWSISILGIAGIIAFANTARYMHRLRQQRKAIKHQQQKQHGIGNNVAVGFPGTGATRPNADGNAAGSQLQDHWSPRDDISRDALQQQKEHATPGSIAKQQALQLAHVGQYQQPPGTNSSVLVSPASTEALPAYPHVPAQHIAPTVPATFNGQIGTPAIVYVTDSPPASPAATGIRNAGGTTTGSTSNGFHGHSSEPDATASAPGCCLSPRSRKAAGGHDASDAVLEVHDGANGGVEGQHDCREELKHKWDWLSCAHCIVMETATTAAFFVSFWYWVGIVAIANSGFGISGGTIMAHAGNVLVAFLQVVLTRLPIVSYHYQVLLWYGTLYMVFLWIFGGITDVWRYGLDWQESKPAGALILIPAITFIMFTLWYLAAVVREGVLCASGKLVAKRRNAHQQHQHNGNAPQHPNQPSSIA